MSHAQTYSHDAVGDSPTDDDYESPFLPGELENLTELGAPAPVDDPNEASVTHHRYLEDEEEKTRDILCRCETDRGRGESWRIVHGTNNSPSSPSQHHDSEKNEIESEAQDEQEYAVSPVLANVSDAIPVDVVENPEDARPFFHHNLEDELGPDPRSESASQEEKSTPPPESVTTKRRRNKTQIKTWIFIVAYLIFFSILGTLARLGLGTLTTYPTSVVFFANSLWPNFAGCLILGFLSEGSELLHHPRSIRSITRAYPDVANPTRKTRHVGGAEDGDSGLIEEAGENSVPKSPAKETLVPIPLHIGLASGFCGSFTTFSTFMLDCFKALSGIASTNSDTSPSPGRDFLAVAGVILITIGLSATGLKTGAHIAVFLNGFQRRLPRRLVRRLNYIILVLGPSVWVVVVVLVILAPEIAGVDSAGRQILFALSFAPLGCLLRFVLSLRMNSLVVGFPLGTFTANAFGSLVLAVTWDLQRLPGAGRAGSRMLGDFVSCQVLQGVEDGFCGCATTVSTWVLELTDLKRRNAYRYGLATVAVGLGIFVVVSGSLKWTVGLAQPACTTI
ncbi:CrcB-like protein-domain-containing protein [Xylaria arbuscula]|nr:CrcB-like protein-domain-containing protein [Xylaria arbuscula]